MSYAYLFKYIIIGDTEPSDAFIARVHNHPAVNIPRLSAGIHLPVPVPVENDKRKKGGTKDSHLVQWFTNFSEADTKYLSVRN
ncbi:transcription initiation factor TFIID subunit 14b-like [Silene latifolia]|uniref:transcription initiation factor TFIID subunit 14b-like n=1 Tax=Silene latifolia TaxID=37657 RepID=UPI003D777212